MSYIGNREQSDTSVADEIFVLQSPLC